LTFDGTNNRFTYLLSNFYDGTESTYVFQTSLDWQQQRSVFQTTNISKQCVNINLLATEFYI